MPMKENLTLTIPEAARLLRISPLKAYEYAREGILPSVRLGRSVRVPRAALDRLLEM
jgi:excisionase family DNA binding protein